MKFLHTSDWHLGMTFRNGVSLIQDQTFFINEIGKIAVQNKVDGILIAGDVFDKSIASNEALALYDETMTYFCNELKIPVFIIAGNHDGAMRLSSCSELLRNSGLYIVGAIDEEPAIETIGDTDIYMLPWISTDKVKSVYFNEADNISSLEDAYRVVLDKYRETFDDSRSHILLSHAYVTDAETSVSDKAAEIGKATMVGSGVFEGFDYVALGHLHGPQSVNETLRYSGTPMAFSFGKEEGQTKSVTIFDTDAKTTTIIPVGQLHKRTTLKGTYDELYRADFDREVVDGYVRLEVTDIFAGVDVISSFREKYRNLLEVQGKSLEREDAKITMTMDELENLEEDAESVFKRYCKDTLEEAPSEHILELFRKSLDAYEKEVSQS